LHEKITKSENAAFTGIRQRSVAAAGFQRACLAGSSHIRPNPDNFGQIRSYPAGSGQKPDSVRSDRIQAKFCRNLVRRHPATVAGCHKILASAVFRRQDFGASIIPVAGCCRIPVPLGFRRPTSARFRQLDIKRVCKDEKYNFRKRFTVFKAINRFPKIKEVFTVKPKMVFVDHYFRPYQTP
jgi:hypothetical protein